MGIRRRDILAGIGALVSAPSLQYVRAAVPPFRRKLGAIEITVISDGPLNVPLSFAIPDAPREELTALLTANNLPPGGMPSPTNVTLVKTGNDVVLIDAGSGIFMALLISIFTGVIYGNRLDLLVLTFLASLVAIYFARDAPRRGRLVRAAGAAVDEEQIKSYALANAPAYQHPRRVFFVDEMPLAGTNKIDKRVLAKQIPADALSS